jgi:hypothetical protein
VDNRIAPLTPAIAPPLDYSPPTRSAATVVPLPEFVWPDMEIADGSYFLDGIDYDRWTGIVRPSPREAFADRIDLLDILDED